MYRAVFSRRAARAFLDLPGPTARRVQQAIRSLVEEPRRPGVIKLGAAPVAAYRFRVGEYRILFDILDGDQTVAIIDIRKRDERTYR